MRPALVLLVLLMADPGEQQDIHPREAPPSDAAARADQLGAIIVKTLDLAEAGISLGITVLSRAGAAAQEALAERPAGQDGHAAPQAPADEPPPDAEPEFFLTNRLPLAPGGEVGVSFSITNDSLVEPKRVQVEVGDFVGETDGVRIPSDAFAVRPARKTIAPADFDKFVLTGAVPAAAPPDVYRGSLRVGTAEELAIPVRLLVAAP